MFYHYAIFLQKLQPKIFLFENVRGLLSHDGEKIPDALPKMFKKAEEIVKAQL